MIHTMGAFFVIILGALPFFLLEVFSNFTFISDFLRNQSSEIMGTMLAINLATLTFLVGGLMRIEQELKKEMFSKSVLEIKHNILFMFIVFAVHLLVLAITPTTGEYQKKTVYYLVCRGISLSLFSSYIFALWEMTSAVFKVRDSMKKI